MTKERFYKLLQNPMALRFFLFRRLPLGWFFGFKLKSITADKSEILLPYRWSTKNPFKSTNFAAQTAAAEFTTGILLMAALQEKPSVSWLMVKNEGEYFKKADTTIRFECTQGDAVREVVERALETGEGQQVRLESVGYLADGTVASRCFFTWSLKRRG